MLDMMQYFYMIVTLLMILTVCSGLYSVTEYGGGTDSHYDCQINSLNDCVILELLSYIWKQYLQEILKK
jgi:hypothetical protein